MAIKGYIDRKVTVWQRHFYTVNTDDVDAAKKALLEEAKNDDMPDEGLIVFNECETLFDTIAPMTFAENGDQPVVETFLGNGEQIS